MSVLWEIPKDSGPQLKIRRELMRAVKEMLVQVGFWVDAAKRHQEAAAAAAAAVNEDAPDAAMAGSTLEAEEASVEMAV